MNVEQLFWNNFKEATIASMTLLWQKKRSTFSSYEANLLARFSGNSVNKPS
jgi:hypothetical protein